MAQGSGPAEWPAQRDTPFIVSEKRGRAQGGRVVGCRGWGAVMSFVELTLGLPHLSEAVISYILENF